MADQPSKIPFSLVPYRLTVQQFERMIDVDIFPEGAHVELLAGILVDKMQKSNPHDCVVGQLADKLRTLLPPGWAVREEKAVVLGKRDRPTPDIAVARGKHRDYALFAPRSADVVLLVEVVDSSHSYAMDFGMKWMRYARAGVPVYWVVSPLLKEVMVYATAIGSGRTAEYRDARKFGIDDDVPVVIEGHEVSRVPVRELFG